MADLELEAKLKREFITGSRKSLDPKLSSEIDKLIEQESAPGPDPFNTPAMKRAKLKAEITEALHFKELSQYVEAALNVLFRDGKKYLTEEQLNALLNTFSHADEHLAKPHEHIENYQTVFHVSDAEMEAIERIAIENFNQKQFEDSLAIFIFLTTLHPNIAGYWHRAGITAQKAGALDLAIGFYSNSIELEPGLISSHLFLIDCYLKLKMFSEAQSQYAIAKKLSENQEHDEGTRALFSKFESRLMQM